MKIMDRNKFFNLFRIGIIGVLITKIFPLNFISGTKSKTKNVMVTINPLAVKRKKVNGKNV